MAEELNLETLQHAADYLVLRKKLRQAAAGSLIFGALAVIGGVLAIHESIFFILLLMIGAGLLIVGIVNLIKPTAEGIIIDGIALAVVGLWNLFITALELLAGGGRPEAAKWGFIGLLQLGWAVRRCMEYPKYRKALTTRPDAFEQESMEILIKKITNAGDKEPGYFQFTGSGKNFKGLISSDAAILVDKITQHVTIAHRNQLDLKLKGKTLLGSKIKVVLTVLDKSYSGTASKESIEKLVNWLSPSDAHDVEPVRND